MPEPKAAGGKDDSPFRGLGISVLCYCCLASGHRIVAPAYHPANVPFRSTPLCGALRNWAPGHKNTAPKRLPKLEAMSVRWGETASRGHSAEAGPQGRPFGLTRCLES